ncbi:MAG: hypothetical protein QM754_11705 [Tepidisphaeraceae bacterium]
MFTAFRKLEQLLRGEATALPNLAGDRFDLPVGSLSFVLTLLGMIYGACMGVFSVTKAGSGQSMQIVASTVKTPALFLATLVVTFPSLYVFNAMFGSRLRLLPMLRLMIGSLAVTLAVLSSIGPIVAFFSVSSTSYAFMVLLNVVVFGLAGVLGLGFLLQTLHRMDLAGREPTPADLEFQAAKDAAVSGEGGPALPPPLKKPDGRPTSGSVWGGFKIWVLVFGLVGLQMAWVLRPFIGSPGKEFTWFRPIGGSVFESIGMQLRTLFGMH